MRRFKTSGPRIITAKFAGACVCCGATIPAGATVTFYPGRGISHVGGLDGNSATCASNIRAAMYPDPGELAEDRWNDTHH